MPINRVDFGKRPLETVEDLYEDLEDVCAKLVGRKKRVPLLYIVDSLNHRIFKLEKTAEKP